MARTAKVCSMPECPEIVADGTRCPKHAIKAWTKTNVYKMPSDWKKRRASVLFRARGVCHWCGGQASEVDHVIPRSQGGGHEMSNLVASCSPCNQRRNLEQLRRPRG